ncbi:MAG: hypothetical protein WBB28_25925 [Crinalium sp.]
MSEKPTTYNLTEENLEPENGEKIDQSEIKDEVENTLTENQETNDEITYENAAILIAITLLPETDNGSLERQVMISASNLGGIPVSKLVHLSDISPLPTALAKLTEGIAEIIEALKIELPRREAQRKLKQSQAKLKNKSPETTGNQTTKSTDNLSDKKPNAVKQLSFFK